MTMTELEIVADYRQAKNPAAQIKVLAELNSVEQADICKILLAHPESGFRDEVKSSAPAKRSYSKRAAQSAKPETGKDPKKRETTAVQKANDSVTAASMLQSLMPILNALPAGGVFDMSCELADGRTLTVGLWPRTTQPAARKEALQQHTSTNPV